MTNKYKAPTAYPLHLADEQKVAANILGGTRDAVTGTAGAVSDYLRMPDIQDDSPYAGVLGKLRWLASRPHAAYSTVKNYKNVLSNPDFQRDLPSSLAPAYNHAFMSDAARGKQTTTYSPGLQGAGDALTDVGILGLSGAAAARMARGPYKGPPLPRSRGRLGLAAGILGAAGMYGLYRATDAHNWRRSGLGATPGDGTALPNSGGDFDNYRARSRHYHEALNRLQNKNVVPLNGQ